MSGEAQPGLTFLLKKMQGGDRQACDKAVELAYGELQRIAARELRGERPDHLLQTTALIHEAYLRLIGSENLEIQSRSHFFAVASRQMRRILVDYARGARDAARRGGGAATIGLEGIHLGQNPRGVDLLLLDDALVELEQLDPRAAKVVELRYFGGYKDNEAAESLQISVPTVRRDWDFARCEGGEPLSAWQWNSISGCVSFLSRHSSVRKPKEGRFSRRPVPVIRLSCAPWSSCFERGIPLPLPRS